MAAISVWPDCRLAEVDSPLLYDYPDGEEISGYISPPHQHLAVGSPKEGISLRRPAGLHAPCHWLTRGVHLLPWANMLL